MARIVDRRRGRLKKGGQTGFSREIGARVDEVCDCDSGTDFVRNGSLTPL